VLPLVAVGLIWSWLYNPTFGLVNQVLEWVGLGRFATGWLGSPETALGAVIVTGIWQRTGFPMLLYLAGLQAIPNEQYEAARIDGASRWKPSARSPCPGCGRCTSSSSPSASSTRSRCST
jgi:ABC-type sugar transport system permease subunit